jgi:hypothetical protein
VSAVVVVPTTLVAADATNDGKRDTASANADVTEKFAADSEKFEEQSGTAAIALVDAERSPHKELRKLAAASVNIRSGFRRQQKTMRTRKRTMKLAMK